MLVEIWSDIVCPWCYIGKRRFETALAQFAHRDDLNIVWRSFELDPNAPRRVPGTVAERLAEKYGITLEQAAASHAQMTDVARDEGLDFRFDRAQSGNTFDAHRLIHLAAAHGLQDAMEERLMRAYFTDGLPIGDPDTLLQLGVEVGLDGDAVRDVLDGDAYADAVRMDERRAASFGITGVPFVALAEKYGVSGAQPSDVFLRALQGAWDDSHPLIAVTGSGAAVCADDSCIVPEQPAASGRMN